MFHWFQKGSSASNSQLSKVSKSRKVSQARTGRSRAVRFESLEHRRLLSVSMAPSFWGFPWPTPPTSTSSLTIQTPRNIVESSASAPVQATVYRTGSTASAVTVNLGSSNTADLTVPASVSIAAGARSATFTITPTDVVLTTAQTVTLTAAASNYSTGVANVQAVPPQVSVNVWPSILVETPTSTATGIVSLNTGPVTTATTINLSSSNTTEASVLPTVTIPVGSSSATFTVSGETDTTLNGPYTVTVTAALAGYTNGTTNVTLVDPQVFVKVRPGTLVDSAGNTSTGTVYLSTGPVTTATTVALPSGNTADATVPASVIIEPGSASATFTVAAVPNASLVGSQSVAITGSLPGFESGTTSVTVTQPPLYVKIRPGTLVDAAGDTSTGTVTLSTGPVSTATTVTLTSGTPADATVPATVTIQPGSASATFTVTAVPNAGLTSAQVVTVTAALSGYANGTANVTVVEPQVVVNIVPRTLSDASGAQPGQGIVYLNSGTATTAETITLTNSDPAAITIPTTVIIPAGASYGTFSVTTILNTSSTLPESVTVTAALSGYVTGTTTVEVVASLPRRWGWGGGPAFNSLSPSAADKVFTQY